MFSDFCHFLSGYSLSFNLGKTPWRLGNWFLKDSILNDCKNNKKQRNWSALFGYISKLIFVNSNSFCPIASHILSKCLLIFVTLILFQSERLHVYQHHIDTLLQVRRNQFASDQGQKFMERLRIHSPQNPAEPSTRIKRGSCKIYLCVNLWESTNSCQDLSRISIPGI